MSKASSGTGRASRVRAVNVIYDQAVRDTLRGGDEAQARAMLDGIKRLRTEYRDMDGLIERLETALGELG